MNRRIFDLDTMADPLIQATNGALLEVFHMLSEKIDNSHQSLLATISDFSTRMETRANVHDREDRMVADRVLILEENRRRDREEAEKKEIRVQQETVRRMGVIAIMMSGATLVLGHFWK